MWYLGLSMSYLKTFFIFESGCGSNWKVSKLCKQRIQMAKTAKEA